MPTRIPIIYGAAGFGAPGTKAKVTDLADAQKFVDLLVSAGHKQFDTSRFYGGGKSEELLGKLNLEGAELDTKILPVQPGDHRPERLKEFVAESIKALNGKKIRTLYLHAPDRTTPFEETARGMDEIYKAGIFENLGLSNYTAFEVAEFVTICRLKGYVQPTVYQGLYNCFERTNELELFPALRKYGIRFAAYSPLAGGFLAGVTLKDQETLSNSRFDPKSPSAWRFAGRFAHADSALREVKAVTDKHGLTLEETAIRWLMHHSQMQESDYGIIFGGSQISQLQTALAESEKGPLPEEVVTALEEAWIKTQGRLTPYWK
ncbi:aflatoxin B1-aldehyde reductase [Stereum hirsutum FP-91666 SS1]|uniref:aflatoxin B1-aldehyde reductase n=1 Tax=Stereum hirsutum (strain FP-91666) TaxID=721885 RepID=UPI000440B77B|nr:aflatoxin B1-aldehyde reductase [Stereum hirsutum FP-91666 SS1]EIM92034.1 aflatoxin B1-aldehyde reductase [Stereum hirsutum FP-91666 SS1]